ncbi:uncharacterized protein LOC110895880 isoform X2 [Helianthus annuus]|uniref:uncharacterized protein LOC110895880 isoform X2 n=1 Tax=Helianthus annuus TaxID=4232 RepID=UPI0016530E3B|nr:uncharacterized protein LOC110895880 isoform X2 [Helianthus annuus]
MESRSHSVSSFNKSIIKSELQLFSSTYSSSINRRQLFAALFRMDYPIFGAKLRKLSQRKFSSTFRVIFILAFSFISKAKSENISIKDSLIGGSLLLTYTTGYVAPLLCFFCWSVGVYIS